MGDDGGVTPSTGVVFPAGADVATLPAFARSVEAWGFDELWVVEDCFMSGGLVMAASALAVTERLRVGVGLLPVPLRNPALAAMEIATIARLHPGRFTATFGHGVRAWMEQVGAAPAHRLAALREVVTAVRALLAGETVSVRGRHVALTGVTLDAPPQPAPPVLIGTTGPRGLAVAGDVADGVLIPEGCGPAFIAHTVAPVAAAAAAGRPFTTTVYAWLSIDDDDERARARLRPALDHWLALGLYPGPMAAAGIDPGRPAGEQPAGLADEVALVGDAAACAAGVQRWAHAGAETVVLFPAGADAEHQYARFAAEALPLLRAR